MRRRFDQDDFNDYENNFGNPFGNNPRGFEPETLSAVTSLRGGGGGGGGRVSSPRGGTVSPRPVRSNPPRPPKEPFEEISHLPIKPKTPIFIKPDLPPNTGTIKPIDVDPVRVKGGCKDPKAVNYDSTATYDNGKCVYPNIKIKQTVKDKNAPVKITVATDRGPATVMVDGKDVGTTNGSGDFHTLILNFTEKELLQRKTITVKKSNFSSRDEWRVSSVQRSVTKTIKPIVDTLPTPTPPQITTPFLQQNPRGAEGISGNGFSMFDNDVYGGFGNIDLGFNNVVGNIGAGLDFNNFRGNIGPSRTSGGRNIGPQIDNFDINFDRGRGYGVDGFGGTNERSSVQKGGGRSVGRTNFEVKPRPILRKPYGNIGTSTIKTSPTLKPPKLTLGTIPFNYYEIVLERKVDGKWVQQPSDYSNFSKSSVAIRPKSHSLRVGFSLRKNVEIIEPPKIESTYKVRIIGDVPTDDTIVWKTNYGQVGSVLDDDDIVVFEIEQQVGDPEPRIEFYANGITDFTHNGNFEIKSGKNNKQFKGLETSFRLYPGTNDIQVQVFKQPVSEPPTKPALKLDRSSAQLNISDPKAIRIGYQSVDADKVIYTLGKVKKTIPLNGTITLTGKDFPNGAGTYTLYVQPVSRRGGSGDIEKCIINADSKSYLPGPDITHINYPQVIKGPDFKGIDVDFNISWQSINTNYIHIYLGKPTRENYLGKFEPQGVTQFNMMDIIKKGRRFRTLRKSRDVINFKLLLVPYNEEGDSRTAGKFEEVNITFDKGDLTLRRGRVVGDIRTSFVKQWNTKGFDDYTSPFLTHYLHLGNGDNKLIGTWGIDETTFSDKITNPTTNQIEYKNIEKSIVLKLYEPLPRNVSSNDKIWISKIQSIPLIDTITITDDIVSQCTPLTPNFNLDVTDEIGYQILDDLITSGSTSSTDVVNQFVSSSNFSLENLNIEFVTQSSVVTEVGTGLLLEKTGEEDYNWKEFIKYSSAGERVENFYYKIKLLENYEDKYNVVNNLTSSIATRNEAKKLQFKIGEVKRGMDAFEKFLYNESSSLSYPGAGLNTISASEDSSTISWFNGILNSARNYDKYNTSRLSFNLPKHIRDDENNSDFILFSDMVGQHFDVIYTHIKAVSKSNRVENKHEYGIDDTMLYHMLESLGWNADMGVQGQALWEYAFGKDVDGNQTTSMSGKDRQHEIWRRLLNNLPYLYKHKGTKRAISAALSCYGVPASLLTIMEFGGPSDPDGDTPKTFTYQDRTASILLSGSAAITVPWKKFTSTFSDDYPNSVEVRINTEQRQDQTIMSTDGWSLHINKDTGSLASIELKVSGSDTIYSSSTNLGALYNDEYTQIVVQKTVTGSNDVFYLYAQEPFQGRIRTKLSSSLEISGVSSWKSGSDLVIGGSNLTASIDEFRLWRTPLSDTKIDNHTLLPDAIDGNHVSASTTDLILRHDFEYPKNRHTSGDVNIKSVSINRTYSTSSVASNFENVSSYPYQYKSYDRDVTAVVPSTGNSVGNKVRFETQTLISDLNYKSRATKKSFDQSPTDSNRLGLFFSPTKEINMDIIKSFGKFNIDDYIGDPSDDYKPTYAKLNQLRGYYFDRYSLNIYEYIQLIRYIDQSLFNIIISLIPGRAQTSQGLLIEPHILERSKTEWKPSTAVKKDYKSTIDITDIGVSSDNKQYLTIVSASDSTSLSADTNDFVSVIDTDTSKVLVGTRMDLSTSIGTEDTTTLNGFITKNSGSDMAGISFTIDNTNLGESIQGEFDSDSFTQIGTDSESLSIAGFGVFGSNGNSIRTKLDSDNNYIQERIKIFLLKKSYQVEIPENITADASQGRQFVSTTKYKQIVNILPFTGSDGNESTDPTVSGDIVSVTPLNGYFPTHYRNTGDLSAGLENSFYNGSKQTSATTLDGGSPVVTFTTNPNTLKVNESGRGSGEPILEVD
tara:strand:+ start:9449 stop:15214 length:5766 start_codon:yes stop_codon:yes gene_type:complete